jgi:hypothetical protein
MAVSIMFRSYSVLECERLGPLTVFLPASAILDLQQGLQG